MVVLFIASMVVMWVAFYFQRGVLQANILNAEIFGLGEIESFNLVQMCHISRTMSEYVIVLIYLLVSFIFQINVSLFMLKN